MRSVIFAVAAVSIAPSLAHADALDRSQVSAEAAWLLHVDVSAAVDSELGRHVIEHSDELDINLDDLEEFEDETGIDPLEDVYGITIYGADEPDDDAIGVISISDAVESLVAQASQEADDYRTMDIDGRLIHVWEESDGTVYLHVGPGKTVDRRTVVVSGTPESVVLGIDVIAGAEPSMTGDDALIKAKPRRGSFVFAAATALPWLDWGDEPAAMIASRSSDITLDVGERDESIYLDFGAVAKNETDATNIAQVLQGLLALGRLISDCDPELADLGFLVDAISVQADGNAIRVEMRQQTKEVIQGLQAAAR